MNAFKSKLENIIALGNDVLVSNMHFGEQTTKSGLLLLADNGTSRGIYPRWAQVSIIGPNQQDLKVGEWILIAHGRWSRGFDVVDPDTNEQTTLRKVDIKDILMTSVNQPTDAVGISNLD